MTDTNFDAFNFDNMVQEVGIDPFAQAATKYAKDDRFYSLTKNKDGAGAALIRFLPDSEKHMIQEMFRINTTVTKNGKKRFVNEFSPSTIGQPCPFQETWQKLWNEDKKEESKTFGRSKVYIANIKVIKDPANPANEGKIFLYQFSGAMNSKLEAALSPSADNISLGAEPKQLFNPLRGNSFRLVAQKGANGQINYDASEVISVTTNVYEKDAAGNVLSAEDSMKAAVLDIQNNTHKLSSLIAPEAFMTYTQLQDKLKWVTFADSTPTVESTQSVANEPVQVVQTQTPVAEVAPAVTTSTTVEVTPVAPTASANTDLDSLLNSLV